MPRFFDPENLTPKQKENWTTALEKYAAVMAHEKQLTPQGCFLINQPGHPKSALFARLLDGKEPLRRPPPKSFGYPWYDCIEQQQVTLTELQAKNLREIPHTKQSLLERAIVLNQCSDWRVLQAKDETTATVSTPVWHSLNVTWDLALAKVPATQASAFIVPWHDPSLGRVTTLKALEANERFLLEKQRHLLLLATDQAAANKALTATAEFPERALESLKRQRLLEDIEGARAKALDRLSRGLPAVPSQAEVDHDVEARVRYWQEQGYEADAAGNLYRHEWQLSVKLPKRLALYLAV